MTPRLSRGYGGGEISGPRVRDSGDTLRLVYWRIRTRVASGTGPGPNLQNDLNDSPLPGGLKTWILSRPFLTKEFQLLAQYSGKGSSSEQKYYRAAEISAH